MTYRLVRFPHREGGGGVQESKVFGVGFHKTATTSLRRALQDLGYTVTGPNGRDEVDPAATMLDVAERLSNEFDAFQDNPWPLVYREMDRLHPGSRFILTLRPTDDWIRSVVSHFGGEDTAMRQWIYGVGHPLGNEAVYTAIQRTQCSGHGVLLGAPR